MNGMKIGALAFTPSRRSWITWPISCTSRSSAKPTPKRQPQNSAYTQIETTKLNRKLTLPSPASNSQPNLTTASTAATIPPPMRWKMFRSFAIGLWNSGSGSAGGAGGSS